MVLCFHILKIDVFIRVIMHVGIKIVRKGLYEK